MTRVLFGRIIGASALVVGSVAVAAPPAPVSIEGRCAKQLGGSYDPARGGWYLSPNSPNYGARWQACVAKARKQG